jgi:hypothetical protein
LAPSAPLVADGEKDQDQPGGGAGQGGGEKRGPAAVGDHPDVPAEHDASDHRDAPATLSIFCTSPLKYPVVSDLRQPRSQDAARRPRTHDHVVVVIHLNHFPSIISPAIAALAVPRCGYRNLGRSRLLHQ